MTRIFPYQYQKSFYSMNKDELHRLYSELKSYLATVSSASPEGSTTVSDASPSVSALDPSTEYRIRIALTSIPDLRFKINSSSIPLHTLLSLAIATLSTRISPTPAPAPVPEVSTSASAPVPSGKVKGVPTPPPTTVPSASPEGSLSRPSAHRADAPNSTSYMVNSTLQSILPSLPPLFRQEAMSIQELYYIPAAKVHQQLSDNVDKALSEYAKHVQNNTLTPALESSILGADTTRQHLADTLDKYEQRIRNFWKRIDWYKEKIEGRNPDPAILASLEKQAHRIGCTSTVSEASPSAPQKSLGSYTRTEIEKGIATTATDASYEEIKNARILRNKKLLNRKDRQKTDSHRDTIIQAVTELHEWGIPIEKGQASTALHYGYEVPQDWLRPTPTKEEKAAKHNEAVKRSNAKKTALQRSIKQAKQLEEQSRLDAFFPPE